MRAEDSAEIIPGMLADEPTGGGERAPRDRAGGLQRSRRFGAGHQRGLPGTLLPSEAVRLHRVLEVHHGPRPQRLERSFQADDGLEERHRPVDVQRVQGRGAPRSELAEDLAGGEEVELADGQLLGVDPDRPVRTRRELADRTPGRATVRLGRTAVRLGRAAVILGREAVIPGGAGGAFGDLALVRGFFRHAAIFARLFDEEKGRSRTTDQELHGVDNRVAGREGWRSRQTASTNAYPPNCRSIGASGAQLRALIRGGMSSTTNFCG
ncbi:hypothetical protein [Brachybacterium sp. GPGPB12]|uniref:hypothetical protein n=1 Tax=Brachybacterium sp. GPGPB12 TaxID=3023517 RepID=UPI0031343224